MHTYTPTVYLLLIYRNRSVDTFWLWVSPLFVLLLDPPKEVGIQNLFLPKNQINTPRRLCYSLLTSYIHTSNRFYTESTVQLVNLTPGKVKDEACVLRPLRRMVGRLSNPLPLLWVAPHYLFVNPKVYLPITRDGYIFNTFKELPKKVVNLYI